MNRINPQLAVDLSALNPKVEEQEQQEEERPTLEPLDDITLQASVMAIITLLSAEFGNRFVSNLMTLIEEFEGALTPDTEAE